MAYMYMSSFIGKRRLTEQGLKIKTHSIPRKFIPNVNVPICFAIHEEVLPAGQQMVSGKYHIYHHLHCL